MERGQDTLQHCVSPLPLAGEGRVRVDDMAKHHPHPPLRVDLSRERERWYPSPVGLARIYPLPLAGEGRVRVVGMAKHHRAVSVLRRSIYNGALCPTRNPTMAATPLNPFDLYDVRSLLSEDERAVQDAVERFTDERVIPIIGDCFDKGVFPKELISEMAELGLLGATLPTEYGCSGLNGVSYGLICQELERGDSGIRSFASVQSSL